MRAPHRTSEHAFQTDQTNELPRTGRERHESSYIHKINFEFQHLSGSILERYQTYITTYIPVMTCTQNMFDEKKGRKQMAFKNYSHIVETHLRCHGRCGRSGGGGIGLLHLLQNLSLDCPSRICLGNWISRRLYTRRLLVGNNLRLVPRSRHHASTNSEKHVLEFQEHYLENNKPITRKLILRKHAEIKTRFGHYPGLCSR